MDEKLKRKTFIGLLVNPIIFGAPIFLSAWTFDYWQAWAFLASITVATVMLTLYLMKHDPALLERRMRAGPTAEKRTAQKLVMTLVVVAFFLEVVIAALDHRFAWSQPPAAVCLFGDALVLLSYLTFYFVCKENSFASATIELADNQKVVSTGPYRLVRHPMYSGGSLLFFGMPLALGSYWGLTLVFILLPVLLLRIVDEEKFLKDHLAGYNDYCQKVKYRLLPLVY